MSFQHVLHQLFQVQQDCLKLSSPSVIFISFTSLCRVYGTLDREEPPRIHCACFAGKAQSRRLHRLRSGTKCSETGSSSPSPRCRPGASDPTCPSSVWLAPRRTGRRGHCTLWHRCTLDLQLALIQLFPPPCRSAWKPPGTGWTATVWRGSSRPVEDICALVLGTWPGCFFCAGALELRGARTAVASRGSARRWRSPARCCASVWNQSAAAAAGRSCL